MSRLEKTREFRKLINANLNATRKLIRVDELSEHQLLRIGKIKQFKRFVKENG